MEQRPERTVGEAVVIFLNVLLGQVHDGGSHALIGLETQVVILTGLPRPAEPDAVLFPQRRRQSHRKAALRAAGPGRGGGLYAVRNDDQAAHRTSVHGLLSSIAELISPTSE